MWSEFNLQTAMYHVLISGTNSSWEDGTHKFSLSRSLREYTDDDITQRYGKFEDSILDELYRMPAIFIYEQEDLPSKFGKLVFIRREDDTVHLEYEIDDSIPQLPPGTINNYPNLFEISALELYRSHWAIKKINLTESLNELGYQIEHQEPLVEIEQESNRPKVFIVHGQDGVAKGELSDQLEAFGCQPIILHEQASRGQTIIEKIEANSDVEYGVVLYTPCDVGGKRQDELHLRGRARQNVIFEHGYLIGKLGRDKVTALKKGNLETPNDISGVVYISMIGDDWKTELRKELQAAGIIV